MATFDLTDLANVKTLLEGSMGATQDTLLAEIIASVSGSMERYLRRGIETVSRTEYSDAWGNRRNTMQLHAYPVATSPALVVKNDIDSGFGVGITALDASLYTIDLERGVVYFDRTRLISGRRVVQVVYTGGIAADSVANLVAAAPEIEMAARLQVVTEFRRRTGADAQSVNLGGGSEAYVGEVKMLDRAKALLNPWKREGVF